MSAASNWEHDSRFRRFAEVIWKDDERLARTRNKGHAAAHRRMQLRYEGFATYKQLVRLRDSLNSLVGELRGSV